MRGQKKGTELRTTPEQFAELLRMDSYGPGIGEEIQALIDRIGPPDMSDTVVSTRVIQAQHLWAYGFAKFASGRPRPFEEYLRRIPAIPSELQGHDDEFPFLSLADPKWGAVDSADLCSVQIPEILRERDVMRVSGGMRRQERPFWFRHDDGTKNGGRPPQECRDLTGNNVWFACLLTACFAIIHHPELRQGDGTPVQLLGVRWRHSLSRVALLYLHSESPEIHFNGSKDLINGECGVMRIRTR